MKKIFKFISIKFLLILGMFFSLAGKAFAQNGFAPKGRENMAAVYGIPNNPTTRFTLKNILLFIAAPIILVVIIIIGSSILIRRKKNAEKNNKRG